MKKINKIFLIWLILYLTNIKRKETNQEVILVLIIYAYWKIAKIKNIFNLKVKRANIDILIIYVHGQR